MILVSFSSMGDALFNDIKNMILLACKVMEISRSAFLGTPSIMSRFPFALYIHTYIHTYNTHLVRHSHKAQSAYKKKVINYSYNHTILLN